MKKLIVGNWKLNPKTVKEAEMLAKGIASYAKISKRTDTVLCTPFPYIAPLKKLKLSKVSLGAEDLSDQTEGAYTGDVAGSMIISVGASYVIIGHSERRARGETSALVATKTAQALKAKLTPIICVGEKERDTHGEYLSYIKKQLHESLQGFSPAQMKQIVIAYEPIWAIGASAQREATPEEFNEVRIFIRKVLSDMTSAQTAQRIKILYGGSVDKKTAALFMNEGGGDGVLVGRASLNAKNFGGIIASVK